MSREMVPLLAFLLLLGPCMADEYYFESLSYTIETSSKGTAYACKLQFVSLRPNLSSIEIAIPYASTELSSKPVVILDKTVIEPAIIEMEDRTLLRISFPEMKVGDMGTVDLRYAVSSGSDMKPGSRVVVSTLGLGGNVTYHALNLKLAKGLTVSKVETPRGIVKPGGSGGVPLDLGQDPVSLTFVLRRRTPLDNPYVVWGIVLGSIGIVTGFLLYKRYKPTAIRAA